MNQERYSISKYLKFSLARNKIAYAASFFLSVINTINNITTPYFLSEAFNRLDDNMNDSIPWLLAFSAGSLLSKALPIIEDEILTPLSTQLSHKLTNDVMDSYFNLPMEQTASSAGSESVHHFGIAYEQIGKSFVHDVWAKVISAAIEIPTALVFVSYKFGSMGFVVGGIFLTHIISLRGAIKIVASAQNGYIRGLFKAYEDIIAQVGQYANAHYFGAVNRELKQLSNTLDILNKNLNSSILIRGRAIFGQSALLTSVSLAISGLIYLYDPTKDNLSFKDFIWYMLYLLEISPSYEKLSSAVNKLYGDYDTFKGLIEYINHAVVPLNLPDLEIKHLAPAISFQELGFSYADGQIILDDVSFEIKSGQTVLLTGPSGAGKSSIFKLLENFYLPQRGVIKIDNQNISNVSVSSLRTTLAIVPQSPVLHKGSIIDNIKYAKENASDREIQEAITKAGLTNLISEKGLDFDIGTNGIKLSGGQRQRIAIARAYLRSTARILLMDEPTSALDPYTERQILTDLNILLKDKQRTSIIITHSLTAISHLNVDYVFYLVNGAIAEKGTIEELLEMQGLFAAQMSIAQDEDILYGKQSFPDDQKESSKKDLKHNEKKKLKISSNVTSFLPNTGRSSPNTLSSLKKPLFPSSRSQFNYNSSSNG